MDKKTDVRDPDEKVVEIEMERLRAFPNHPFKVIGDSQMIERKRLKFSHSKKSTGYFSVAGVP